MTTWSFFHLLTGDRTDGVSKSEALRKFASIPAHERAYWMVWTQGLEDWIALSEADRRFFSQASMAKTQAPKPSLESERRRHSRREARFRVILKRGQECFRTFSKDVSRGGAKLERQAPKRMLGQPCEIFIARPDLRDSIRLIGVPVADERDLMRVRFTNVDADSLKRLSAWAKAQVGT